MASFVFYSFVYIARLHEGAHFPSGMNQWAIWALWAKSSNIQWAGCRSNMSIPAGRAMLAKSPSIPHAFLYLTVRVNVQVHALWVAAFAILAEEPTFRHLFQVELVQKLARLALLAQAAQPVLAHH